MYMYVQMNGRMYGNLHVNAGETKMSCAMEKCPF